LHHLLIGLLGKINRPCPDEVEKGAEETGVIKSRKESRMEMRDNPIISCQVKNKI